MISFIARRLLASVFVVLGASFIVYLLMANAGDPLAFTQEITNPTQRAQVVTAVTNALNLDVHPVARYFLWLGDLVRGDLGDSARTQLPVLDDLSGRILITLKLVMASLVLSVSTGVTIGIVTAIRQYSGFDYLVTFFTFVFFSLPVFWVAVIIKSFGGINFNDWLRDNARFSLTFFVVAGIVAGVVVFSCSGGSIVRKLAVTAIGVGVTEALLIYVSTTRWLRNPGLGPVVIALFAIGVAVGVTAVMAGLRNHKARNSALVTAGIGIVGWFPLQWVFDNGINFGIFQDMNVWTLFLLAAVAVLVGVIVGNAFGGFDRGLSARTAAITAFFIGVVVFVDRTMQSWDDYSENSIIRNRPIKTIGDREGRLEGDFWLITNDTFSHLVLPTLALMLISLASYTRYSRSSMLEVLNQDYIRTARSKGLTERTVLVRHGFRNAMIPLATVVAFDVGGLLGGAVITETVFEWNAMGRMFQEGLLSLDPNPVMAVFLVVAVTAVVFNLLADLAYVALDPRIRIGD
jgi:peptide/nickel transport system permease protein